ncbi:hypothetical protein CDL12_07388 [Handroanthus impetiginosus]|uniref:Uncharacterized protein n=1 Tax=Handroanthus impetiginosus TaxID=429701 RepID=A0A2G9HRL1_9LAMI|nr:hypothetical protein CDL12_07388 [Handroanthus impetiginosus]
MVDSRLVLSQVQQVQMILLNTYAENMILSESFQIVVMTEKLPLSQKDFKNYFEYKRKETGLEDLIARLWIVEDK